MDPKKIGQIAQIASVLEVSGYPKPGNVHRTRDFHDMVFEDFLISGIVIGDSIEKVANSAILNNLSKIEVGKYILEGVKETNKWIANNTNLGIIMLLTPIAASAAISDDFKTLRENIYRIIKATTVNDAINLYEAINIADAGGMGNQDKFDVNDSNAINELIKNNQNIFDVLEISASWDNLAYELVNKMPISFNIGCSTFYKLNKSNSLNNSTILTFLTILSEIPDTLISRKYGNKRAEKVSNLAKDLLKYKNEDSIFNKKLNQFDDYLFKNKLNPGTTADLTAASIMLSYLKLEFEKL